MKEEQTPTYRAAGKSLLALTIAIDKELREQAYRPLSFARLNDIAEAICLLLGEDEKDKPRILGEFCQGLMELEMAAIESPEVSKRIAVGAQKLLIAMCNVAIVIARDRMRIEVDRITPLARRNQIKENVISRARTLAHGFWSIDVASKIRTGEMAETVYKKLVEEGHFDLLPDSAERLKEWIKPVAPEYAKKGGRRKLSRP
ncbi:hypothetical protein IFT62_21830 [Pseudomonas lutea]|uniref:Uncharacterized protein n=1 Tax=Pseudomonas lutea TaxID=243924 RepID=A0ABR9ADK6_9PSED|nr:hypothetical protein [Pseudomonas lutea]MBD8123846.1 hypothetical protein [Pseudomonas lutea]